MNLSRGSPKIIRGFWLLFNNIDSFVKLSRENTSIEIVEFYPFDSDAGNYELWDKVGQIVGNCVLLQLIDIHFLPYPDDDYDSRPDWHTWKTLARILPYVRHQVSLCSSRASYYAEVEEIQGLARAIHGHPMISGFSSLVGFRLQTWVLGVLP
jgi:hypothetical protein